MDAQKPRASTNVKSPLRDEIMAKRAHYNSDEVRSEMTSSKARVVARLSEYLAGTSDGRAELFFESLIDSLRHYLFERDNDAHLRVALDGVMKALEKLCTLSEERWRAWSSPKVGKIILRRAATRLLEVLKHERETYELRTSFVGKLQSPSKAKNLVKERKISPVSTVSFEMMVANSTIGVGGRPPWKKLFAWDCLSVGLDAPEAAVVCGIFYAQYIQHELAFHGAIKGSESFGYFAGESERKASLKSWSEAFVEVKREPSVG